MVGWGCFYPCGQWIGWWFVLEGGEGFQRVMVVNIAVGGRSDRVPPPKKKIIFFSKTVLLVFKSDRIVVGMVFGGEGGENIQKGSVSNKWKKNSLTCFLCFNACEIGVLLKKKNQKQPFFKFNYMPLELYHKNNFERGYSTKGCSWNIHVRVIIHM